jgi:hypothetical protein
VTVTVDNRDPGCKLVATLAFCRILNSYCISIRPTISDRYTNDVKAALINGIRYIPSSQHVKLKIAAAQQPSVAVLSFSCAMAFSHSRYTDVRQSTFNETGRDHISINQTHVHFSLFGSSGRAPIQIPRNSRDLLLPTTLYDRTAFRGNSLAATYYNTSDTGSVLDTAAYLIVQIADRLMDGRNTSNSHRNLAFELESLYHTLTMTGLAINGCDGRPLGQSLANTITPEVEHACFVLQKFLSRANSTWLGLFLASIGNLWRRVWWSRGDGDELVSLRQLSDCRKSLEAFLMALHSYVSLLPGYY